MRSFLPAFSCLALGALAFGCGAETSSPEVPTLPSFGESARGSSVILDADRFVAWVADADNRAIHRVDLRTKKVSTTELAARPEQLARVGESGLAVTLRESNQVALFEVVPSEELDGGDALSLRQTADVASDPYGIAVSPRGEILVTSGFGNAVTSLAADTLEVRFSLPVAREPRGVVVSPDGSRAYITHLVGSAITVVSLENEPSSYAVEALGGKYKNRMDRASGAGTLHPTSALAFSAAISPSGSRLFVPHVIEQNGADTVRSIPGAYGGVPVEEETSFASVAVFAPELGTVLGVAPDDSHPVDGLLPIAVDPGLGFVVAPEPAPSRQARGTILVGDALLVASQGTNQLVELSALAIDPATSVRRIFEVGEGPSGVDADEAAGLAVVWNQLSHDISVVHLASGATDRIPVSADPLEPDVAAGRRLFLTERDRRITRDGRACAGCHPEGREDGIVWKLGAGPRQTPVLVGRLNAGPFGWLAKHDKLEDNMNETMTRLGGTGLPDADAKKLARFLREGLVAPNTKPIPGQELEATHEAQVFRGRELFTSGEVGCSSCHTLGKEASDRALHIVGSRTKTDTTDGFRTPPLLFIKNTAPYFHDGRYPTIEALLFDNFDRMGQTTQLSGADIRALATFVRTL